MTYQVERRGCVSGLTWIPKSSVSPRIVRRLRLRNPRANGTYAEDGAEEFLRFYRIEGEFIGVPRYFRWGEFASGHAVQDETVIGRSVRFDPSINLRPEQVPAVDALVRNGYGILEAPCGAGKTVVMLAVANRVGRSCLVLVHTQDLVDQWVERSEQFLGTTPSVLAGRSKTWTGAPITVGLIQALRSNLPPYLVKDVGVVFTDEVHRASAPSWNEIVSRFPAARRYGASATLDRPDGLETVFMWSIGPVVYQMEGRSMKAIVCKVRTPVTATAAAERHYSKLVTAVTKDPVRIRMAVEIAQMAYRAGRNVLILVDRVGPSIELGRQIAQALSEAGSDLVCVRLGSGSARAGGGDVSVFTTSDPEVWKHRIVVASSSLAKEGLDVAGLDFLIDLGVYSDGGRAVQSVGRVIRIKEGKPVPIVVTFIDDVDFCRAMASLRLRSLESDGHEVIDETIEGLARRLQP